MEPTATAAPESAQTPAAEGPKQSVADGLQNVVAGLGTSRDKRSYSMYAAPLRQSKADLDAMFQSSWLARRIVTTVADDMTRAWVKLSWDGYDDDEGGAKEISRTEQQLGMRGKVNTAIRWGRFYGGAVIVICQKGEPMDTPLVVENVKKGTLAHLQVLDRHDIIPEGEIDQEFGTENYGLPLFYKVVRAGAENLGSIHWTRVVRFGGNQLPYQLWLQNQFWDDTVLQSPLDSVKNYETATHGAASMIFEANVDVIRAEGLADMLSTPGGDARVTARWLAALTMKSFNRTLLLDMTEEYQQKTTQFAGVTNIITNFLVDMCGAADIPATRLFGMSPGGLNATGESDLRNYYDHVAARQQDNLLPQLLRIYEVLVRSTRGQMPEGFEVTFNPLWQTSKLEDAQVRKLEAETDQIYLLQGVLSEGAVAREVKDRGTYRTMEDEDVEMAEELAKQPDPVPVVVAPGQPGAPKPGAPGALPTGAKPGAPAARPAFDEKPAV